MTKPPIDDFVSRRQARLVTLLLGAILAFALMAGSPSNVPIVKFVRPVIELVAPAEADAAHLSYSSARSIARDDCGRAWDWDCYRFPTYEDTIWPFVVHYQERRPLWTGFLGGIYLARRNCYTYWVSSQYNEHHKLCGSSF